eukprot:jgi/Bigna1/129902/aug1.10_g4610
MEDFKNIKLPKMAYITQRNCDVLRDNLIMRLHPEQWILSKLHYGKLLFKHSRYGEALVILSSKRGRIVVYPHPETCNATLSAEEEAVRAKVTQMLKSDSTQVLERNRGDPNVITEQWLMTEPLQKTTLKNLYEVVWQVPF